VAVISLNSNPLSLTLEELLQYFPEALEEKAAKYLNSSENDGENVIGENVEASIPTAPKTEKAKNDKNAKLAKNDQVLEEYNFGNNTPNLLNKKRATPITNFIVPLLPVESIYDSNEFNKFKNSPLVNGNINNTFHFNLNINNSLEKNEAFLPKPRQHFSSANLNTHHDSNYTTPLHQKISTPTPQIEKNSMIDYFSPDMLSSTEFSNFNLNSMKNSNSNTQVNPNDFSQTGLSMNSLKSYASDKNVISIFTQLSELENLLSTTKNEIAKFDQIKNNYFTPNSDTVANNSFQNSNNTNLNANNGNNNYAYTNKVNNSENNTQYYNQQYPGNNYY